jgi:hypothetical protein
VAATTKASHAHLQAGPTEHDGVHGYASTSSLDLTLSRRWPGRRNARFPGLPRSVRT